MLKIYPVSQKVAQDALRVAEEIARKDHDLAKQLRRAATSVVLNLAEGAYLRGGTAVLGITRRWRARRRCARFWSSRRAQGGSRRAERDAGLRQIIGTLVRVLKLR